MTTIKNRAEMERALASPSAAIRCYLLYGPDESGSRALAAKLATALGADAERIDLSGAQLKADPALLSDEAASVSLFGGARHIRVEGAGEDCLAAVEALIEAPAAGNPVVLIAGALKKDAKLVKRLEGDKAALVFVSYPPEGAAAGQVAAELARAHGLRLDGEVARRLADACNGDRAVLTREIEKIALYVDATPDAPREATHAVLDAIGVDAGEADTSALLLALFGGDTASLERELARAAAEGVEGISLVRRIVPRLLLMVTARQAMERGTSAADAVSSVARYLPRSAQQEIATVLPRWSSPRLAAAVERMGMLERDIKLNRGAGPIAADQLLFAMARSVRR